MRKLIIFDMDGLMFDTEAVTFRSYLEVGRQMGYETTWDQYKSSLGKKKEDILDLYHELFGPDMDAEKLFHSVGIHSRNILRREGVPVKPGLFELLDAIDTLGLKKAIASSSDQKVIEEYLESVGIEGRFDLIFSARRVKRGKPNPDVFLEVCKRMSVAPEDALVLEDSYNGVLAALNGAIPVICVPDMVPLAEELSTRCEAVVETLSDVISYL